MSTAPSANWTRYSTPELLRLRDKLADLRSKQAQAKQLTAAEFRARYPTPGALAKAYLPRTRQTPALDAIDAALVDLADAPDDSGRQMVFMSPQEGKSSRVSCWFPLWLLAQDPTLRVAIVSYSAEKAERWGKWIRRMIEAHPELGITLMGDSRAVNNYETTAGGRVLSVGVSGGITGEPVDCLRGDTVVTTERGPVRIEDLHRSRARFRVLTLNHATGRTEWRSIQATRVIPERELVEVVTATGRRFTCTPDHLVHTPDGYRQAQVLRPGDRLTVGRVEHQPDLSGLRQGAQGNRRAVPEVLASGAYRGGLSGPRVLAVRPAVPVDARRGREAATQGAGIPALLGRLPDGMAEDVQRPYGLPAVRAEVRRRRGPEVLRPGVSGGVQGRPPQAAGLPALRRVVHLLQRAAAVLHTGVRERGPLATDGRHGELPLQGRDQLRRVVPVDEAVDPGAGQRRLRGVRRRERADSGQPAGCDRPPVRPGGPSHQRGPSGQPSRESDHVVYSLPRVTPQVEADTVSVVRELRGERDTVYDLQVEGNHNFFAGEVLVHNCLIIDDPVAGRSEAQSPTYRERAWEWWESNGSTRLSERGRAVLILTRWHQDDLAGRLIEREPGAWKVLRIPAVREPGTPLVRGRDGASVYAPNGELVSVRNRRPGYFLELKARRSMYVWNSIYMQTPVAAEGNLFHRDDFRYWTPLYPDRSHHDPTGGRQILIEGVRRFVGDMHRFITMDLAATVRSSADWTVAAVWGITLDGDLVLLDRARERIAESAHWALLAPLCHRWACPDVYVERGFIGTTLVIDATRAGIRVQPLTPEKDKITRALPATQRVKAHSVFFPDSSVYDWHDEWCDEIAGFPTWPHDDQLDTFSYAARIVSAHWNPPPRDPDRGRLPDPVRRSDGDLAYEAATGMSRPLDLSRADW